MADMEAVCARLCLLTRAAWRDGLPAPLTRPTVRKMIRLGALNGLTLRRMPEIRDEHYARAEILLSRSAQIYSLVEACRAQGFDVMLPEDENWPVNLYALGTQMPQFLFTKGNRALFSRRSVAVAGSRDIGPDADCIARRCGASLAQSGYAMVCGGAWGVDTAAQRSFLDTGGGLILVPAYQANKLLNQQYLSHALEKDRLLIVCDTLPQEAFSAAKALTRNHAIYALGDAALVVASRPGIGGSWNGAKDCLRGGYTPVFAVDAEGDDFLGNRALIKLGVKPIDMNRSLSIQLFAAQEG